MAVQHPKQDALFARQQEEIVLVGRLRLVPPVAHHAHAVPHPAEVAVEADALLGEEGRVAVLLRWGRTPHRDDLPGRHHRLRRVLLRGVPGVGLLVVAALVLVLDLVGDEFCRAPSFDGRTSQRVPRGAEAAAPRDRPLRGRGRDRDCHALLAALGLLAREARWPHAVRGGCAVGILTAPRRATHHGCSQRGLCGVLRDRATQAGLLVAVRRRRWGKTRPLVQHLKHYLVLVQFLHLGLVLDQGVRGCRRLQLGRRLSWKIRAELGGALRQRLLRLVHQPREARGAAARPLACIEGRKAAAANARQRLHPPGPERFRARGRHVRGLRPAPAAVGLRRGGGGQAGVPEEARRRARCRGAGGLRQQTEPGAAQRRALRRRVHCRGECRAHPPHGAAEHRTARGDLPAEVRRPGGPQQPAGLRPASRRGGARAAPGAWPVAAPSLDSPRTRRAHPPPTRRRA
mmetsp:Transcript_17258/g.48027  ORF Transcript_17258/g.48027 Transcript_17258/m.48027 type:complete len:459 (+) Transcript_17258:848-2224(+)